MGNVRKFPPFEYAKDGKTDIVNNRIFCWRNSSTYAINCVIRLCIVVAFKSLKSLKVSEKKEQLLLVLVVIQKHKHVIKCKFKNSF